MTEPLRLVEGVTKERLYARLDSSCCDRDRDRGDGGQNVELLEIDFLDFFARDPADKFNRATFFLLGRLKTPDSNFFEHVPSVYVISILFSLYFGVQRSAMSGSCPYSN